MAEDRAAGFEAYVRSRRSTLLRTALLLTAGDHHRAEDVVQTTLMRLYVAWPRAGRTNLDAYARRILVNCVIDAGRRPSARREVTTDVLPDGRDETVGGVEAVEVTDHAPLWAALRALPARMRTAVVLRYVEDLSVTRVAELMRCSEGTVKSQSARGLEKVRAALGESSDETPRGERCTA